MIYTKNDWKFDANVSSVFDDHVMNSVPMYKAFHKDILDMSVYFAQKNSRIIDVGTSTGTLIHGLCIANEHRGIECIGIDIEQAMIDECNLRYTGIAFEKMDALMYDYSNTSVVTCVLSLQFIKKADRKVLIQKIYDGLNEDGVLFIVEKLRTGIPDIHDIYNDIYYDFKRDTLTDSEILDKNTSLRGVMKPLTMGENLSMLKAAGFKKIDTFMKFNNFVGIMAVK